MRFAEHLWSRLLDGSRPWGSYDATVSRYGVQRCQLILYPPGCTTADRRLARLWRGWPLTGAALALPLLHWSRMAELSCDRAALLVVQDPSVVARALSKLAGWSIPRLGEINLDEVVRQIKEEEGAEPAILKRREGEVAILGEEGG